MLHVKDVYALVSHVQSKELFHEAIERLLSDGALQPASSGSNGNDIVILVE
jgi:hypothetical protein